MVHKKKNRVSPVKRWHARCSKVLMDFSHQTQNPCFHPQLFPLLRPKCHCLGLHSRRLNSKLLTSQDYPRHYLHRRRLKGYFTRTDRRYCHHTSQGQGLFVQIPGSECLRAYLTSSQTAPESLTMRHISRIWN